MFDRFTSKTRHAAVVLAVGATTVACSDSSPTTPSARPGRVAAGGVTNTEAERDPAPPSGLVTVSIAGGAHTFFPYTADDFSGAPKDPINAVFAGYADPLRIRAALRRLDGNRTAFGLPAAPPFDCTWKDAIGDEQAAFGDAEAWTGSAVQLACGEYSPFRFHMRLFKQGDITLAGVHMDLHIPNTNEHEAIAWELPEQVLVVDMIRTGLLAGPPQLSAPITQSPTFREIRLPVWNGIPTQLKALVGVLGGPAIPNDGRARLFDLGTAEPIVEDIVEQEFVIQFNQAIPKPFCGGPNDYLFVTGPIYFRGVARVTPGGTYHRESLATAELVATPVNPLTGQSIGAPLNAKVSDDHAATLNAGGAVARARRLQQLFNAAGVLQASKDDRISAGTIGHDRFVSDVYCAQ